MNIYYLAENSELSKILNFQISNHLKDSQEDTAKELQDHAKDTQDVTTCHIAKN